MKFMQVKLETIAGQRSPEDAFGVGGVVPCGGVAHGLLGYHLPWRWLPSRLATFKAPTVPSILVILAKSLIF